MNSLALRTAIGAAALAIAVSTLWAVFGPAAFTWPGLAVAATACVIAVWAAQVTMHTAPALTDVIGGVEAEPVLVPFGPARDIESRRTTR